MYFLSIKDEIWDILARLLESLARYLFFFIGKFIYSAIRYVYNIFVALCNGRILDNDSIMALFSRIGVILGVVMLFVVSFSVIQLLVNPDAINDAEKGIQNIVKKIIFVIVMLGVSGYVFNILAEVQAIVIERDIIPKLLLPRAVSSENVGGNLSAELFMIFYQVGVEPEDDACGETYRDSTKAAIANGDFTPVSTCLTAGSGEGDGWVFFLEYNWLFSTIFGIAALWFIFSYCITVGVRLIQLTFLQIISPAAIIGYLSPKKDNIFSKWIKIYFSTYIDVFIRIAIINFAMYLIALIMDQYNSDASIFWTSVGSPGIWTKGFIAAIMITAILQFAKKAPELLKQLLPQGASGLGYGAAKLKDLSPISRTAGVVGGALGAATVGGIARFNAQRRLNKNADGTHKEGWVKNNALGLLGGIGTGLFRGGINGGKSGNMFKNIGTGVSNQSKADDKYIDLYSKGGSNLGRVGSKVRNAIGETKAQASNRRISNYQGVVDAQKKIQDLAENISHVKKAKTAWENAKARGASAREIDDLYTDYKQTRKNAQTLAMRGEYDQFVDSEDRALASQINTEFVDLTGTITSNNIEIYREDGTRLNVSDIDTADRLNEASYLSSAAITKEKSNPDYRASLANDAAAGVNSNDTKK